VDVGTRINLFVDSANEGTTVLKFWVLLITQHDLPEDLNLQVLRV